MNPHDTKATADNEPARPGVLPSRTTLIGAVVLLLVALGIVVYWQIGRASCRERVLYTV